MILTVKKVGGGQPFISNMEKKNHMLIVQLKKKAAEHYTQYNLILKTRIETKPVHVKYTCTLKSQERNKSEQAVTLRSELVERRGGEQTIFTYNQ